MFEVGEKVVHKEYGICEVVSIQGRKIPGCGVQTYYELTPLPLDDHATSIFTKVEHGGKLRAPMTREQILEMIDSMPGIQPLEVELSGNRMIDMERTKTAYEKLEASASPQDWVVLLKTIYQKTQRLSAQRKRISEFEARVRSNSERMLYGEIAIMMEIPFSSVETLIEERIESAKEV